MMALGTVEVYQDDRGDWFCESRQFRWSLATAHRGKPLHRVRAAIRASYAALHTVEVGVTIVKAKVPIECGVIDVILAGALWTSSAGEAVDAAATGFGKLPNTGCVALWTSSAGNVTAPPGCRRSARRDVT